MIHAKPTANSKLSRSTGLSARSQITPGIASSSRAASAIRTGRKTDNTSSLNDRADSSPPSPWRRFENIGTKAAENAPSANSRRKTLGIMKAWNQASVTAFAPSTREKIISRAIPATRLTMVSPPMVPTFRKRLMTGTPAVLDSGLAARRSHRSRLVLLLLRQLLHVERVEIDRVEQKWRKAGVASRVRNHPAGERNLDPRRLGIGEAVLLVLVHVAHPDEPAIGELDDVGSALRGFGRSGNLEFDLADLVVDLARADVELHVDLRLLGPLKTIRCLRVLHRKVLDVLR